MRNYNKENSKKNFDNKKEFRGRNSGASVGKDNDRKFSASSGNKRGNREAGIQEETDSKRPYRKTDNEHRSYGRPGRSTHLAVGGTSENPSGKFSSGKGRVTSRYKKQPERPFSEKKREDRSRFGGRFNREERTYVRRPRKSTPPSVAALDGSMRLNRYLANAGICSRREADVYIQAGVVSVNGQVVSELGSRVLPGDEVRFHEQILTPERKVYVLLNKPKGYVTTTEDPHARQTVMELVQDACRERIYPVGRLDKATTGVLLLTNDGELAKKLTHPKYKCRKIYQATLDKKLRHEDMLTLAEGVELEDGFITADALQYVDVADHKVIGVEIHSGRNRIVRRMFEKLGYQVEKLDRVMFAGLTKNKVPRGAWRFLTEKEVSFLKMGNF